MEIIKDVMVKDLKVIPDERGRLMEMMRNDEEIFGGFGQVYLTIGYPGVVKGWHYHKEQYDHFTVVKGMMKLVLYDMRKDSPSKGLVNEFFIGEYNCKLVRIPPYVLHGFKAIGQDPAYVVNVSSNPYYYDKPDEFRIHPHDNDIPYKWEAKDG